MCQVAPLAENDLSWDPISILFLELQQQQPKKRNHFGDLASYVFILDFNFSVGCVISARP